MDTPSMEKLILLHLTPEVYWTVDALRQRIMEVRIEAGDWPLKAYLVGLLFGTKAALYVGDVPTPIYFQNAFEALEQQGAVYYDPRDPAKGWKITKIGLRMQRLYQLGDAEEEHGYVPSIH